MCRFPNIHQSGHEKSPRGMTDKWVLAGIGFQVVQAKNDRSLVPASVPEDAAVIEMPLGIFPICFDCWALKDIDGHVAWSQWTNTGITVAPPSWTGNLNIIRRNSREVGTHRKWLGIFFSSDLPCVLRYGPCFAVDWMRRRYSEIYLFHCAV